jgi:PTH2 family peptidyl-tRNA hydrolase
MKQVIVVRKDLKLSKGKMAVHAAHASLAAYKIALKKYPEKVSAWELEGEKKSVLKIDDEKSLLELYEKIPKEIPKSLIRDAGKTHIEPGTLTCFAAGPWDDGELDKYTGHLKLVN